MYVLMKWIIVSQDNGLSPSRGLDIAGIDANLLSIGHQRTNLNIIFYQNTLPQKYFEKVLWKALTGLFRA